MIYKQNIGRELEKEYGNLERKEDMRKLIQICFYNSNRNNTTENITDITTHTITNTS